MTSFVIVACLILLRNKIRSPMSSFALSFAALIATTLFVTGHEVHVEFSSPKLWAALVAGIVAWKSGNVFATIATGMGTLYLLKWLLSTGLL